MKIYVLKLNGRYIADRKPISTTSDFMNAKKYINKKSAIKQSKKLNCDVEEIEISFK